MTRLEIELDYRNVCPQNLQRLLRAILCVRGEQDSTGNPQLGPESRVLLDVEGWLAWMDTGFTLFGIPLEADPTGAAKPPSPRGPRVPALRIVLDAARRLVMVLAMRRHGGSLSRASRALETSERMLRDAMRAAGLDPWVGHHEHREQQDRQRQNGQS